MAHEVPLYVKARPAVSMATQLVVDEQETEEREDPESTVIGSLQMPDW